MSPLAVADEMSAAIGTHGSARTRQSTIRTGGLAVDLETRIVSVHEKPVRLTGKEYSIVELLSLRKGTTVTKEMLVGHLYGGMDEPGLKIIDVFVCHLRKKLAQATGGKHYQTLYRDRVGPRVPDARSGPSIRRPIHERRGKFKRFGKSKLRWLRMKSEMIGKVEAAKRATSVITIAALLAGCATAAQRQYQAMASNN